MKAFFIKYRVQFLVLLYVLIGIFAIALIGIPIYLFYDKFHQYPYSDNPQQWGVFGDYIGGILNPIIGIISLIILGYLTYLVAVISDKTTKNLFTLERKMVAYDEIARHIKEINLFESKFKSILSMQKKYSDLPKEQAVPALLKMLDELRILGHTHTEFYYTINSFNLRYGHLFKYDFKSEKFSSFLKECKKMSDLVTKLVTDNKSITPEENAGYIVSPQFLDHAVEFVNSIREELKIK